MSKQPVEVMMDAVPWEKCPQPADPGDLPYPTHQGVLVIAGLSLRCYRLSNGQSVFHADDIHAFFSGLPATPQDGGGRGVT